jgi:hypothetical protein
MNLISAPFTLNHHTSFDPAGRGSYMGSIEAAPEPRIKDVAPERSRIARIAGKIFVTLQHSPRRLEAFQ